MFRALRGAFPRSFRALRSVPALRKPLGTQGTISTSPFSTFLTFSTFSLFSVHSEVPKTSAHPPLRFPAPTPSFGTILRTFPRFRTLRKYSRSQVITLLANSLHSECSGVFSHATSAPSGAFRSEQQAPISAGTTCNDVRASQPKRL